MAEDVAFADGTGVGNVLPSSTRYRFSLPAPLHFKHRFLESPVPTVPSPWHSGHVTSQSSSRS